MLQLHNFIVLLTLLTSIKCERELSLKILKSTGDYYTPVQSQIVEERAGANFSLLCDLVSTENNTYFDWQVSWVKQTNDLRFWREQEDFLGPGSAKRAKKMYSILTPSEINKAVKRFQPLKLEDKGNYFCVSLKYNLHKVVEVVVRDDHRPVHHIDEPSTIPETISCSSEQMFQCVSTGVCIIRHYTCDGKADCKDGSDESEETCHGDPCKDKLQCEDGRCIPTSWCCDRHLDPNCTVTNRPKCCQILSQSYDDLEYGPPHLVQAQNNGIRYIFISVCILSILFFIVLLFLILSKVVIFAKKTTLQQQQQQQTHNNYMLQTRNFESIALNRNPYQNRIVIDNCDNTSDPLLTSLLRHNNEQPPPPYVDVVRLNIEPPPPYTSREILNIDDF